MAEWQYQIRPLDILSSEDLDRQLEISLAEYGAKGWELVEVLNHHETPNAYRFIFKAPKPLD